MADNVLEHFSELPFYEYSYNTITEMFETPKNILLERLKNNSFSENMIKLINGFSKDKYTCNYYHEESINELAKNTQQIASKCFTTILIVLVKIAPNLLPILRV